MRRDIKKEYLKIKKEQKCVKEICKIYTIEQEDEIYKKAITMLKKAFPKQVNERKLEKRLKSTGHIYTIIPYDKKMGGFQNHTTGDIFTLSIYTDSIDHILFHEIVHKWLENIKIKDMSGNIVYSEIAVEYITEKALNEKKKVNSNNIWNMKMNIPENIGYMIEYALFQQITFFLDEKYILKTGRKGNKYFDKALKSKYGKTFSKDVDRIYKMITAIRKENRSMDVKDLIEDFQNKILINVFEKEFKDVKDIYDIVLLMKKMQEFEILRMRLNDEDKFLENYYTNKYEVYIEKYPQLKDLICEYDKDYWKNNVEYRNDDIESKKTTYKSHIKRLEQLANELKMQLGIKDENFVDKRKKFIRRLQYKLINPIEKNTNIEGKKIKKINENQKENTIN